MRITNSIEVSKISENQKVIIYGAGRYGVLAYYGLKSMHIEPYAFIDSTYEGKQKLGIDILSPECLEQYTHDVILIASYNYFLEMYEKAYAAGCENIYDIENLLKANYDESVLDEYTLDEKHNLDKYCSVIENCGKSGIIITHLEMVVTECCSLKCKDCANLMQYYEHPCNLLIEDIFEQFDRFLNTIDLLLELRILGGEPFIVKDLDRVINKYVNHNKIKRITIYTNSTIVPQKRVLTSLMNNKVSVHMSNYGIISSKVDELNNALQERNIKHYIHSYDEWIDIGYPQKNDYSKEQVKSIFKNCLMAKCFTFYRGKLYVCPRAAHGERIGFYQNYSYEYVDFTEEGSMEDKREKIIKIMQDLEFVNACYYCKGSSSYSNRISAAIQKMDK